MCLTIIGVVIIVIVIIVVVAVVRVARRWLALFDTWRLLGRRHVQAVELLDPASLAQRMPNSGVRPLDGEHFLRLPQTGLNNAFTKTKCKHEKHSLLIFKNDPDLDSFFCQVFSIFQSLHVECVERLFL